MSGPALREFMAELYFERRLAEEYGRGFVFDGATDRTIRRERIREAIVNGNLGGTILGKHPVSGQAETFAAAFERHYRETLEGKP